MRGIRRWSAAGSAVRTRRREGKSVRDTSRGDLRGGGEKREQQSRGEHREKRRDPGCRGAMFVAALLLAVLWVPRGVRAAQVSAVLAPESEDAALWQEDADGVWCSGVFAVRLSEPGEILIGSSSEVDVLSDEGSEVSSLQDGEYLYLVYQGAGDPPGQMDLTSLLVFVPRDGGESCPVPLCLRREAEESGAQTEEGSTRAEESGAQTADTAGSAESTERELVPSQSGGTEEPQVRSESEAAEEGITAGEVQPRGEESETAAEESAGAGARAQSEEKERGETAAVSPVTGERRQPLCWLLLSGALGAAALRVRGRRR